MKKWGEVLSFKLWNIFNMKSHIENHINLKLRTKNSKLNVWILLAVFLFAIAWTPARVQGEHFTSGADFLLIGSGARSEGMGGAFTAVADDVNALTFNPAGLALLKVPEVGYLRMIYVADMAYNFGGVAVPFAAGENSLGLGLGIVNLGVPEFDSTLGIATPISASDNAVLLSFAYRIQDKVSFGLTGKYLFRSITGYNAAAIAGDFGVLATPVERLRLAAGVFNVGQSVKFISAADSLPTQVKLGLSYEFVHVPQHSALFSLEGAYLLPAQAGAGAAGAEYWYDGILAARLGFAGDAYQQRWTAGVGVRLQMFQFDYSYSPVGTLGDAHRLSVLLRLGSGEGAPGLSAPSGFAAEPFDNGIFLKWRPASSKDVVGYHLYVKKPGAAVFTRVTGQPLNDTSVRLKSMQNGKAYAFALTSVSAAGRESGQARLSVVAGAGAAPVTAPAAAPPAATGLAAPTGFKAEALADGFRLSWDQAGPDIAGFHLYLADETGNAPKKLTANPIAVDRLELKNIFPERLYRFSLTRVNKKGEESAPAALDVRLADLRKGAAAVSKPAPSTVERPAPVLTIEPTPTPVPQPASPEQSRGVKPAAPATAAPEKTAWFNEGGSTWLTAGKVKKFTVKAGDGKAMLSWEAVPNAVGYNLYVSFDENKFILITKNGPQNILALSIKSLKNGKTYYFAVTAVDVAGHESEKTVLPAVPQAAQ
jgi:hypothetical protein